jgi:hypothetical protein
VSNEPSSRYKLKHNTETIRRLHTRCAIEPKHVRSKSCELYRKAVETFNRDLDEAVETESAENAKE